MSSIEMRAASPQPELFGDNSSTARLQNKEGAGQTPLLTYLAPRTSQTDMCSRPFFEMLSDKQAVEVTSSFLHTEKLEGDSAHKIELQSYLARVGTESGTMADHFDTDNRMRPDVARLERDSTSYKFAATGSSMTLYEKVRASIGAQPTRED